MTRDQYKHALLELLSKERKIKKECKNKTNHIEWEINQLTEEYAREHSVYELGNNVLYKDISGIEHKRKIHEINVLANGDIVYDIGTITKITNTNVYHRMLTKWTENNE